MLPLNKSVVRPHLEFSVEFWSPHLHRDIGKIERVQRKATKMIPEIRNHSYQQRLMDLELISLVQRHFESNLLRCSNRFNNVSRKGFFDYDFNDRTRNNGKKCIVNRFNTSFSTAFLSHQYFNNLECATL